MLDEWLDLKKVGELTKDAALYPGFTPEFGADLRKITRRLFGRCYME